MTLRELYPYWPDIHTDILERLDFVTRDEWNDCRAQFEIGSVRQIVVRMIRHERRWIAEIAQKRKLEPLQTADLASEDDLISELRVQRSNTERFVATLTPESLRSVRTAPADPENNDPERNVTLAWILWNVLEYELMSWGQIQMRLSEQNDR
jgi:uncharacterized damage-inducible protein DinB